MKTEHNGMEIEYREFAEEFYCPHYQYGNQSLKKVKEYIDRKQKEKFERTAIIGFVRNQFFEGHVTSHCDDDGCAWVVMSNGHRSKERFGSIIIDTPENRGLILANLADQRAIDDLSRQMDARRLKMARYSPATKPMEKE